MAFQCQMCGECCSTMGEIISILEQTGEIGFRIGYSTTMEERDVTLDPDKQDLFFNTRPKTSMACPFLRAQAQERAICTVHHSRPDLCRDYSCFRTLILDAEGRGGREGDGRDPFHSMTTDPRSHAIWQDTCRLPDIIEEREWELEVERILAHAGYRVLQ